VNQKAKLPQELELRAKAFTYEAEEFLEKYPDSDFADDARISLQNLGKSPEELIKELEERVEKGEGYEGKRILITGCPMVAGNNKIVELIEEVGGVVVGEESCTGTRFFENYVEGYSIEDIAKRYFKIPCACRFKNDERIENIKRLVKELDVDGVVYYTLQYCHTFNIEGAKVEEALKEEGIPVIRIETDYSESDREQLKTRLEAFIEMI